MTDSKQKTNNKKGNNKKANNKKVIKNETEGNVLIFYVLQSAASSVLKCKLSAIRITFQSAVKARVQYEYLSENGISNDEKKGIEKIVNNMLKSEIKVSCSKRNNNDCKIPDGIRTNLQLYDIKINHNNFSVLGVSHIPISINNLGLLSDFKILKSNYKSKKNILEIMYSFKSKQQENNRENNEKNMGESINKINSYFDEKIDEKDDRMTFSKEIIEVIVNDLNVEEIDKNKLDKLVIRVHDILNRYQNISYTKGLKAAK